MSKNATYTIITKTGSAKNAGTDANVSIIIYGSNNQKTDSIKLVNNKDKKNKFEVGKSDEFDVTAVDVGKITKVNIGHDGKGIGSGWFLDSVTVKKFDETYVFNANRWLSTDEGDKKTNVDLTPVSKTPVPDSEKAKSKTPVPDSEKAKSKTPIPDSEKAKSKTPIPDNDKPKSKTPVSDSKSKTPDHNHVIYTVITKTGAAKNSGTDAIVSITIYGSNNQKTDLIKLVNNKDKKNKFEVGKTDEFEVTGIDVGKITKINIGHDGKGIGSGWFLDSVTIKKNGESFVFNANRWLSTDEGDKKTNIDLMVASKTPVSESEKPKSKTPVPDTDKAKSKTPVAEQEKQKSKTLVPDQDKEKAKSVPPNRAKDASPEKSKSTTADKNKQQKPEQTSKTVERQKTGKVDEDNLVKYIIKTKTGYARNAGTDSKVYITIYGTKGKTDKIPLTDTKRPGKPFEKSKLDEFHVRAPYVGLINKINIGHDADGEVKSWYLESVVVSCGEMSHKFDAKRWLDKNEGDGKTYVEIQDSFDQELLKSSEPMEMSESKVKETCDYTIEVKTGSDKGCGTDGVVQITIYTLKTQLGPIKLDKSNCLNPEVELFSVNSNSIFKFQDIDLDYQIDKIKIDHDACKTSKAWFLDSVKIKVDESVVYGFIANKWLDRQMSSIELKKVSQSKTKAKPDFKPATLEQFTHAELKRLKTSLQSESSKIRYPKRKTNRPFVFNDLYPYYDTSNVEHLIDASPTDMPIGYYNRMTVQGIVEPWVAYNMERNAHPSHLQIKLRQSRTNAEHSISLQQLVKPLMRPNKNEIEGSTLTPRFPKVTLKKPKDLCGPFYIDDVDDIRREIRKTFGTESTARQAEDKTRTVNDYYRMKLDYFHPLSKQHMIQVYHAYLENTVGSKKALDELLKNEETHPLANSINPVNRKSRSALK